MQLYFNGLKCYLVFQHVIVCYISIWGHLIKYTQKYGTCLSKFLPFGILKFCKFMTSALPNSVNLKYFYGWAEQIMACYCILQWIIVHFLFKLILIHLILYVTRFSIGLKNLGDFLSPEKIFLWYICPNLTEYSSAIEYSAEIYH
jgi:hypothetical protein